MNHPHTPRKLNARIAIFNLDGSVSDDRWRRARVPEGANKPQHFDEYHAGCADDPPMVQGAAILANHISNGDFIVFTTGRPGTTSDATAKWISDHFGIQPSKDFIILMRDVSDGRSSVDLKRDYLNYVLGNLCIPDAQGQKRFVVAAYDSRRDVVEMYRAAGIDASILTEHGEFLPSGEVEDKVWPQSTDDGPTPEGQVREFAREHFGNLVDSLNDQGNGETAQSGRNLEDKQVARYEEGIPVRKHSHYFKPCPYDEVDVYRVLSMFEVTDPCIQHAVKKLLVAGGRGGGKDISKDVKEAADTLERWQEMRAEWLKHNPEALPC